MQVMKATLVSIGQHRGVGYLVVAWSIAAVTTVCTPLHDQLDNTTVALALLLMVLFMAILWGRGPFSGEEMAEVSVA
jgi:hypothetical protein